VFLQQLGRGLRQAHDKAVLTALDFVGHQRKEFRFDRRFTALTGASRGALQRQVEQGFPFLPSGCQIVLDDIAQRAVLGNIRSQVSGRWREIVAELRAHGDQQLRSFVRDSGVDVSDIIRTSRSWTALRREAGLVVRDGGEREPALLRRVRALAHVDDLPRTAAYRELLADDAPPYDELDDLRRRYARMLFFSLWPDGGGFMSYDAGLRSLRSERAARDELVEIIDYAMDFARHLTAPLIGPLGHLPLRVHAQYQREEVLAALDYANLERRPNSFREGVLSSKETKSDAFFVTLNKTESDYSPTTMYRDYAISPDLFHWESQSTTTVASPTGQRYLKHEQLGWSILLFTRSHNRNELGTAPYLFLGPATYVEHNGERPIAITWKLEHAMSADAFHIASVVA
jgi:hypothetical protein